MLKADLALEMEAVASCKARSPIARSVQRLCQPRPVRRILDNEEEHVDTLETQFEMIERMGTPELHPAASEGGRRTKLAAGRHMATIPSTDGSGRIVTLDIIRGVAVMGIFSVNIIAFAMIDAAYSIRRAYGGCHGPSLACCGLANIDHHRRQDADASSRCCSGRRCCW